MDEFEAIKKAQRELAESWVLIFLLAAHLKRATDPDDASRDFLDLCELQADLPHHDHLDPAMNELASQEFRDTLIRLGLHARSLVIGEPFDPDAYRKSWRRAEPKP